jgi:hypothetical protein
MTQERFGSGLTNMGVAYGFSKRFEADLRSKDALADARRV